MHVEVEAATLAAALAQAAGAIEGRVTMPILGCVLIEAEGQSLRLRGTNLEREARVSLPATVHRGGSIAVSAMRLGALAKRWPDGALASIEAKPGEASMIASTGRAKATLRVLSQEDFPAARGIERPTLDIEVPAAALKAALGLVRMAQSTEGTRYYLNGTYWHEVAGRLVLVATDGHRLVRVAVEGVEVPPFPAVIVPRHAARQIMDLASGDEPVRITLSEARVELCAGAVVVSTSLVDGTYPDYGRVIPLMDVVRARVKRDDLLAALQRVRGVFAGLKDAVGRVRLAVLDGELGVACETADGEAASDVVDSSHEVRRTHETGVNGRYLVEALEAWPEGAVVEMLQDDPTSPMIWRLEGETFALCTIMPMRV
jgi:DNA polymerase-3 subunit beta